jgi:glycosyltransferase involved in cell wall biosynthesis
LSAVLRIGIDASNLRIGGGVTHLVELLSYAEPAKHSIAEIVVWGCSETLDLLANRPWLTKISIGSVNKDYLKRLLWQRLGLSGAVKKAKCDLLFVPGGNFLGGFHPAVTMSRNMLPFKWAELSRYGFSFMSLRLLILRQVQSYSFRAADGMIFLTSYAKDVVQQVTGKLSGNVAVIPHGMNLRFVRQPKVQYAISSYSAAQPFRLVYVSIIDVYKHQWQVVKAVDILRKEGFPLELELIGPSYAPAMARVKSALKASSDGGLWAHCRGKVPYTQLDDFYAAADMGIFASSCENMPNILLETMAAGLPVACSNRGPMPNVLGDAGVYFNPENPLEIASAIRQYLLSPELRANNARKSFEFSQRYSWKRCADETLAFLSATAKVYRS